MVKKTEKIESPSILRYPEVCRITGLSQSALDRLEQSGDFCPRVRLSPRAVGWLRHEVSDWLQARAKNRKGRKHV